MLRAYAGHNDGVQVLRFDSPCYYWGNVMLEKLRIYNGEKKSKPRLQAEQE